MPPKNKAASAKGGGGKGGKGAGKDKGAAADAGQQKEKKGGTAVKVTLTSMLFPQALGSGLRLALGQTQVPVAISKNLVKVTCKNTSLRVLVISAHSLFGCELGMILSNIQMLMQL